MPYQEEMLKAKTGSLSILVVDDNEPMRILLEQQFEILGHKVHAVPSGIVALEFITEQTVDAIILDYVMPVMNGLEVFKKLRVLKPEVPVIMMTAHGNISLVERFMDEGGAGFVEKPWEITLLDTKIKQIILNWKLKRAEAARKNLSRALHTITQLLGSGAHEIRTALTIIEQRTRFLSKGISAASEGERCPKPLPGQIPHLDVTTRNVKRLLHLVDDLIDFSRVESGEIGEMAELNLNEVVEETLKEVAVLLDEKPSVELVTNLQRGLPPVHGNPRRMYQIITNLLTNAMKFTDQGTIVISTSQRSGRDWVELTVADTGIGISRERQPDIFGEFTESTQSHLMTGSGLGLSIAQLLTNKMGGEINFKSEEGKGTQFFLRFPVALEKGGSA